MTRIGLYRARACLLAIALCFAACDPKPTPTQNAPAPPPKPSQVAMPTRPPMPTPTRAELSEAASKGLVKVSASGDGLESISVSIESKSADPLEIIIPSGTIFKALSGSTQSMVAREETTVTLESRGTTRAISVDAACATMYRKTPGESDQFTIRKTPASDDLKKLLTFPAFRSEDFRVQQFAIWTITDNPGRDEYVGVGQFEFSNGPDKDEIRRIRTLFEKAGISTKKYRALR